MEKVVESSGFCTTPPPHMALTEKSRFVSGTGHSTRHEEDECIISRPMTPADTPIIACAFFP